MEQPGWLPAKKRRVDATEASLRDLHYKVAALTSRLERAEDANNRINVLLDHLGLDMYKETGWVVRNLKQT
jgi:hypothetical protein